MLTESATEQGIRRVLVCHLERQKGPWSSEGERFTRLDSGD